MAGTGPVGRAALELVEPLDGSLYELIRRRYDEVPVRAVERLDLLEPRNHRRSQRPVDVLMTPQLHFVKRIEGVSDPARTHLQAGLPEHAPKGESELDRMQEASSPDAR